MARIQFQEGEQSKLFFVTRKITKLSWNELAKKLSVHTRTLLDWRKEKYTLSQSILNDLTALTGQKLTIPKHKILPDYWHIPAAAQKGGRALANLYGGPGTPDGRKKGGKNSQIARRLNPELYANCNVRKKIAIPQYSNELAELIGILAGDGGINNDFQIVITLNRQYEQLYAQFIKGLIEGLFSISPTIYYYRTLRKENAIGVIISSVSVVEFLKHHKFEHRNKVLNQIDIPEWIKEHIEFSKNCLRGLVDTDGGIFHHRHSIKPKGKSYLNIGLVFSNKSAHLLNFVKNTLFALGFHPKVNSNKDNILIYKEGEVFRYAQEVGFHNVHHIERINQFTKNKYKERCVSG